MQLFLEVKEHASPIHGPLPLCLDKDTVINNRKRNFKEKKLHSVYFLRQQNLETLRVGIG